MPQLWKRILLSTKLAIILAPSLVSLASIRDSSIELIENSSSIKRGHLSIGVGSSYVSNIKANGPLSSLSLTKHISRPKERETRYRLAANIAPKGPAKTAGAGSGAGHHCHPATCWRRC